MMIDDIIQMDLSNMTETMECISLCHHVNCTFVVEWALKGLAEAALLQSLNEQKHIFSVVSP